MNDMTLDLLAALQDRLADEPLMAPMQMEAGAELPLSYAQEQLWVMQRIEPELTAYNLPRVFRLAGRLDSDALERGFQAVVARHAVLRTRFFERGGIPLQTVLQHVPFQVERIDLSGRSTPAREAMLAEAINETLSHVFDLGAAPALRVRLIKLGAELPTLAVCLHHIVSDAWSNPILAQDLATAYRLALREPGPVHLPPLSMQYLDYAVWQRARAQDGSWNVQIDHWNAHLGADVPTLDLPVDHTRAARQSFSGTADHFELEPALGEAVQKLCRAEKCTPFVVLLSAWQVLLARYSGQNDFAIGVPNAGRHREELQDLLGFFVTTQVFRVRLAPHMTLRQVCRQVRGDALSALAHADLPFELLLASRQERRDPARSPLFQVMFDVQVGSATQASAFEGLCVEPVPFVERGAKYDLSLDIGIDAERVQGRLEYNTDLFDARTVKRLMAYYVGVLECFVREPDGLVAHIELPLEAERAQLHGWGVNAQRHPDAAPVHRLMEQRVREHPQAVALVFGEESLTYGELNGRANRLAHRLIQHGVKPETCVGIAVERSIEMVVGLLAILKAGGAYVPLDPEYPQERLAYMVQDSGIGLLLTQSPLAGRIPSPVGGQVLLLDRIDLSDESEDNPAVDMHRQSLAYVIYTSGSTGQPKGVGISQASLAEHSQVAVGCFGLSPDDRMLQFSTINFDGFVEQLFAPLVAGAAVVLRGPTLWDSETFYRELIDQRISVLDLTTAYWFLLVQDFARQPKAHYGALRQVHVGGEAMPPEGLKAWSQAGLGQVQLKNAYGPTEAAVTAAVFECQRQVDDLQALPQQMAIGTPIGTSIGIPIGTPLPGRALHVLDASLSPVPPGVAGELCIGGDLLARGYGQRPGLTAERFVADPFDAAGGRLYRSGDLVKWNEQGQLVYLGRIDHQVKIRGFRVELGEIEAQLLAQPEVREAVVVARPAAGGLRLVAYVALRCVSLHSGRTAEPATLRARLGQALPEYMVPSAVVVLEHLPLNANGKIDRQALPEAELGSTQEGYEAPQGEVEEALAAIWAEVLGVPRVGRRDNFFELGGHSISALRVVAMARLRNIPGLKLTLRSMISTPTIQQLRAELSNPMTLLNQKSSALPPLFCIHSGLGTVLDYLPLAKALNGLRTVYGLSCRTLSDPDHRDHSLEAMAHDYTDLIRGVQTEGPYHLLGWSLGGALAALVAARFEAAGQEVHFLGLVDSFLPTEELQTQDQRTSWQADYLSFLGKIMASTTSTTSTVQGVQLPDDMGDPLNSEQPLLVWTQTLMNEGRIAALDRYAGVAAEDLVRSCLMDRCLTQAINRSLQPLRPVRSAVHCWWARDTHQEFVDATAAQLGSKRMRHLPVDADHDGVVSSDQFLNELCRLLAPSAALRNGSD